MKVNFTSLTITILILFTYNLANGQGVYWVDNNGSSPWSQAQNSAPLSGGAAASISTANANAQPGDIIYMRGGDYNTTIRPNNSGTSGSLITFQRYQGEKVVFDGLRNCVVLDKKDYIVVDGIYCYRTSKAWVVLDNGSSNNTIKNSVFETAYNWDGISMRDGTTRNTILNNSFLGTCSRTSDFVVPGNVSAVDTNSGGPADFIYMTPNTSYNLIEGNDFGNGALHQAIMSKASYNIYRSNIFQNKLHTNLGMMTGLSPMFGNVIESNVFLDAGKDYLLNYCGSVRDKRARYHNQIVVGGGRNTIIRGNVFTGGVNVENTSLRFEALDNRVYNNTHYRNIINYFMYAGITNPPYDYNGEVFINNILAKAENFDNRVDENGGTIFAYEIKVDWDATSGNSICNNNIWNANGGQIVLGSNNTCGNSNMNIDPKFVNEAAVASDSVLRLQAFSPMIDAGSWLTTITSSTGSGTVFQVDDAKFFFGGYGMVEGDLIQFEGQNTPIRITDVSYSDNRITVSQNTSWTNGLGIALPYSGNKPDIGAHEYYVARLPEPGAAIPITYEGEDLLVVSSSGDDMLNSNNAEASNGQYFLYKSDTIGDYVTFNVTIAQAGEQMISLDFWSHISRGTIQLSIDGTNVGSPVDQNRRSQFLVTDIDLGYYNFPSTGIYQFKFTNVARNASSGNHKFVIDLIRLTANDTTPVNIIFTNGFE
ncbi:MAG: hypothetical protein L3J24_04050 [Xanthomonadales bacterium]|nr:hypothetical protein [Xanthomonadales bacterium]